MDPDVADWPFAHHREAKPGLPENKFLRKDARAQDLLLAVDVGEKGVERRDALDQPSLHRRPFGLPKDTRDDVERNQPLGGVGIAIDRKGDADAAEEQLGLPPPRRHHIEW